MDGALQPHSGIGQEDSNEIALLDRTPSGYLNGKWPAICIYIHGQYLITRPTVYKLGKNNIIRPVPKKHGKVQMDLLE